MEFLRWIQEMASMEDDSVPKCMKETLKDYDTNKTIVATLKPKMSESRLTAKERSSLRSKIDSAETVMLQSALEVKHTKVVVVSTMEELRVLAELRGLGGSDSKHVLKWTGSAKASENVDKEFANELHVFANEKKIPFLPRS